MVGYWETPPCRNGQSGARKRKKKRVLHVLTCCSIFVNIVNHGLADGNVNCTCGSNKTSRLITFTDAMEDSPPPARTGARFLQPWDHLQLRTDKAAVSAPKPSWSQETSLGPRDALDGTGFLPVVLIICAQTQNLGYELSSSCRCFSLELNLGMKGLVSALV